MGKSAPQPPPVPDPTAIANAQSQSNIATANNQANLNKVGSSGPYGSVLWQADPSQPGGWTQNTTLSPEEQAIFNLVTGNQTQALGVAGQQIGRVSDALATPFSYAGLPGLVGSVTPGQVQTSVGGAPAYQQGYAQSPLQMGLGQQGAIQGGFSPGQGVQGQVNFGQVNGQIGPSGNIQMGVAAPGQLAGGYGSGGGIQGQVAGAGGIQGQIGAGGPIQMGVGNPQAQYGFGPSGAIQNHVGGDYQNEVNQAINGVYGQATSRLDPQFQRQQSTLEQQLANQGLGQNSAAYQNAMDQFGRTRNDAYNQALYSAIGSGQNEQNTLFGQSLAGGQFANQAQQQQYNEQLGRLQAYNTAAAQNFNQGLAQGTFGNQAQLQQFGEGQQMGQFANNAQAQQFGQNLNAGQFANQAQQQGNQQNLQAAQFGNQAVTQGLSNNIAAGQFANQAQGQQFGQNAQQQAAMAAAMQANNQNSLAAGQFANQAAGQQYAQNQGQAAFANQAQQQAYQQALGSGQFANQSAIAQSGLNQQQAQFFNQAVDAIFQQAMASGQFANAAEAQQYAQQQAAAQFQNQARTQGAQEQAYAQNLPISQLSQLMGLGGSTQAPSGIPYTPTSVAPTDVLGAYALSQQQANANYQAQSQQYNSSLGGLFNLGSSALSLIPYMSDVRVKRDIARVGTWRGHNLYSFRYLWDDEPQLGVMAQEVMQTRPDAVADMGGGLLGVRYGML